MPTDSSDAASGNLSPKAKAALQLLAGSSRENTRSAKALANLLWPDRIAAAGSSTHRQGLYRAAGSFFAKLERKGLVGHYMDDFGAGYYLKAPGIKVLDDLTTIVDNYMSELDVDAERLLFEKSFNENADGKADFSRIPVTIGYSGYKNPSTEAAFFGWSLAKKVLLTRFAR